MTPIGKVQRAAKVAVRATQRLQEAIVEAREMEHTLRDIAAAANMSHETVRGILKKNDSA